MLAQIIVEKDSAAAASYAARRVVQCLSRAEEPVVALPAGDTPLPMYAELLRLQGAGSVNLAAARYIGVDEWQGAGADDAGGHRFTLNRRFFQPAGIKEDWVRSFDGRAADPEAEAASMRAYIDSLPQIDLAVLGVGLNGYVGFNEPGTVIPGSFGIVKLSQVALAWGKKYFGGRETPAYGATISLDALFGAKNVVLLVTGPHKREIMQAVLSDGADCPATRFCSHKNAVFVLDMAANPFL